LWDTSGSTDTAEYANALVLLGLLTRGREKDASGKMASDVGPLAEQAIRICEKQTCPEDTFPLALELLSGVLSATSDEAGAQAAAARAFRLRNLPDGPPFPPKSGPSPRGAQKAGGAITAPRISFQRQPEFCEAARWARREGEVVLQIIVNSDGTPRVTKVVRPLGFGLDEKAVEAVSQWRFIPGTKAGAPVNAMASIVVTFRLL
jgi:TonB family protein